MNSVIKGLKRLFWVGCLTPNTKSVGDHAQTLAVEQFLKDKFSDYKVKRFYDYEADLLFKEKVEDGDLIFLQSGGHFGSFGYLLWHQRIRKRIIAAYPRNLIVQLPVSVYYNDVVLFECDKVFFSNRPNLTILCRSEWDAKLLRENFGCDARYFPDFTYYLKLPLKTFKRKGVAFVLRRGFESNQTLFFAKIAQKLPLKGTLSKLLHKDFKAITYNYGIKLDHPFVVRRLKKRFPLKPLVVRDAQMHNAPITDANRGQVVLDTLNFYRQFKLVVTDRYHAAIFSQLTETPYVMLGCKTKSKSDLPKKDFESYFNGFRDIIFNRKPHASIKTVGVSNNVIANIKQRRSVRKWLPVPVEQEKLNAVLEAGYYAPSAANTQAVKLYLVQNSGNLGFICENTSPWFRKNMPAIAILILYDLDKAKECKLTRKWHNRFVWQDTACASMNIMLVAESIGLKTCWASFNPEQQKRIQRQFGFKNAVLTNAVLLGYSNQNPNLNALHQGRTIQRNICG